METVKILIVDDEPVARRRVRRFLKKEPGIEIVGEPGDGKEAVLAILEKKPDLVFLDVQMPELDGFDVIETIGIDQMPQIVFVTAYDQYTLRAFDVNAVDYLLKPFEQNRFKKALDRALKQIELKKNRGFSDQLKKLLEDLRKKQHYLERLVIKEGGKIFFLRTDEIEWIESAGNYVNLHAGDESYMMRETMKNMESKLDPGKFARISRSNIVNKEYIKEIQKWFGGDQLIILKNGSQLTLNRRYSEKVLNQFG